MNSKLIASAVITLAALTSASAFAGSNSAYSVPGQTGKNSVTTSTLTRAQVLADYLQARNNGTLPQGENLEVRNAKPMTSTLTREQVLADYLQARDSGTLPQGENLEVSKAEPMTSTLTRAQVRSEVMASGRFVSGEQYGFSM